MNAKEMLEEVLRAKKAVGAMRRLIETLEERRGPAGVDPSKERVQVSRQGGPVETLAVDLAMARWRLAKAEEEAREKDREARSRIAMLKKQNHRWVLELRYLEGLGWQEIAEVMAYAGVSGVFKCHKAALNALNALNEAEVRAAADSTEPMAFSAC